MAQPKFKPARPRPIAQKVVAVQPLHPVVDNWAGRDRAMRDVPLVTRQLVSAKDRLSRAVKDDPDWTKIDPDPMLREMVTSLREDFRSRSQHLLSLIKAWRRRQLD